MSLATLFYPRPAVQLQVKAGVHFLQKEQLVTLEPGPSSAGATTHPGPSCREAQTNCDTLKPNWGAHSL